MKRIITLIIVIYILNSASISLPNIVKTIKNIPSTLGKSITSGIKDLKNIWMCRPLAKNRKAKCTPAEIKRSNYFFAGGLITTAGIITALLSVGVAAKVNEVNANRKAAQETEQFDQTIEGDGAAQQSLNSQGSEAWEQPDDQESSKALQQQREEVRQLREAYEVQERLQAKQEKQTELQYALQMVVNKKQEVLNRGVTTQEEVRLLQILDQEERAIQQEIASL